MNPGSETSVIDTLKKQAKSLIKGAEFIYKGANVLYRTAAMPHGRPNAVFVWIPKTAGTSLFSALEKQIGMINLCESMVYAKAFKNRGPVTFGHYCYRSLLRAGIVSQAFHVSAYKFCVVRDPYDRALSLYYYLRRKEGRGTQDFLQFLAEVHKGRPPVGLYNYQGLSQANPQVDWILDEDGQLLVDKIYRFEGIEEIEQDLRQIFDLPDFQIGHKNKVERDRSSDELFSSHSEIIPLIEEIYAKDFDSLKYDRKSLAPTV